MNLFLAEATEFEKRHIGPNEQETNDMLATIGIASIGELIDKTIPENIRRQDKLSVPDAVSEYDYLKEIKSVAANNKVFRSYIGQGYYNTITPSVILRNIYENPAWYTSYTPYQAEISQGRLESLLNFQTIVSDLTGLEIANASLLDEATAAAEAMHMVFNQANKSKTIKNKFFVDNAVFAQTLDVILTRAIPKDIEVVVGDYKTQEIDDAYFGALIQYPNSNGSIEDYKSFIKKIHAVNGFAVVATDLLALTLLKSPGELGADVAVGNSQRFGVPIGYGGPHAGFFATKDLFKRAIPGRIIGVSIDAKGNRALRLALQTREQHIKRDKATSNICTAQALLANMAAMYAVYHGPKGLKQIAQRIVILAQTVAEGLTELDFEVLNQTYFDTIRVKADAEKIKPIAEANEINFYYKEDGTILISLDETTSQKDVLDIIYVFANSLGNDEAEIEIDQEDIELYAIPDFAKRTSSYLTAEVFNTVHTETQMMRYIKNLEKKDIALNTSMISLGSCTMKLNAATEMIPTSWPEFANIHPFAPKEQTTGFQQIIDEISVFLCSITGFDACSLQPNSGAQGEFAGLNTIMRYHQSNGQGHRNIVLIPISAHGTNPASGVMAGMQVVIVKSDDKGQIDIEDLRQKATENKDNLSALMVTYPSTYGIFEEGIKEICDIIHENGGQVYMDGANMNAQVAYTCPGIIGADVCHLNLHKTFAIPHGGGGPGVGPICCKAHLAPHLPGHVFLGTGNAVSAAPFGSANILLISYAYIRLLGVRGLKKATQYAILNANYMKSRLEKYYQVLFTGKNNTCAHEFMVDIRPIKESCGITAEDVAKRLMDYGFHAPTVSFPVHDALMIEPTESEDKAELDRFCDAMIAIFSEIQSVENGTFDKEDNPLKNAPHTQFVACEEHWLHTYSRAAAVFPLPFVAENKFWPSVARVNNTQGDRNLICSCTPTEAYA
ncbi:MAG: aminomethyl-transferring glycine dehydrogenase [Chitinophagaceae bacterium]